MVSAQIQHGVASVDAREQPHHRTRQIPGARRNVLAYGITQMGSHHQVVTQVSIPNP